MQVENTAWLIPTHRSKFQFYAKHYNLTKQYAPTFKHFAVVTSSQEAIELRQKTDEFLNIIILEEYFSELQISRYIETRSIINVKKLFGLLRIYKDFDNIIITDDEIELFDILTPIDILEIKNNTHTFHRISNTKTAEVISSPIRLLDNPKEKNLIFDFFVKKNFYGWFSNLPIYETKYLDSFFARYKLNNSLSFDKLKFEDFDFILYQYSLFLDNLNQDKFTFYDWDLPDIGGSLWEMYYINDDLHKFIIEDLLRNKIIWIPNHICKKIVPDAKMVFNVDRDYSIQKISFEKLLKKIGRLSFNRKME